MILRIWFSRASETHPWRVQIDGGEPMLVRSVLLCGQGGGYGGVETIEWVGTEYCQAGLQGVPDGPKGYIEIKADPDCLTIEP